MMTRFYFSIFLMFTASHLSAQVDKLTKFQQHYLFTFLDDSYLIVEDSIFVLDSPKPGFPKPHNLDILDFNFVTNDSVGYMKNRAGGKVYLFDGKEFRCLDKSFDFKSQNFSYSFIRNGSPMDFGGYGLHTFKNIITYFDPVRGETELLLQKSSFLNSPFPRQRMIGKYHNGNLYLGPGYGSDLNQDYPSDNFTMLNDFWVFSFDNLEWKKLGDGIQKLIFPNYFILNDFGENPLVLSENSVFEVDIENNILIQYPKAKYDILKTVNRNSLVWSITYSKKKNGFYLINNKLGDQTELIFVKKDELLGTEKFISKAYNETGMSIYVYLIPSLVFVILLALFILSRKSSNTQKIRQQLNIIREELKLEDFKVLNKLLDASPEFINYSELMDVFPDHYGYDSKKKKSRQSIENIEEYLHQKLKLKSPIFAFRKNIEDRREKQIKIN